MAVTPGSKWMAVLLANDLKPKSWRRLTRIKISESVNQ
jgi:hypothetical protein